MQAELVQGQKQVLTNMIAVALLNHTGEFLVVRPEGSVLWSFPFVELRSPREIGENTLKQYFDQHFANLKFIGRIRYLNSDDSIDITGNPHHLKIYRASTLNEHILVDEEAVPEWLWVNPVDISK